jgi:hypothetical protein
MASLEDHHLIPKHEPNQFSPTDHYLQRRFAEVEPSLDQRENYWLDEVDIDELYQENGLSVAADMIAPEEVDETCVASQVILRGDEYRFIGLTANIALGPKNRIYTISDNYFRIPTWSTNAKTEMFSSRPRRWTSLKTTKRAKNGKVWRHPWPIFTCTTVVVWINWA